MNFGTNLQHDFPKMRGSKAVCNFSEKSSVLVASPVPKDQNTSINISLKHFGHPNVQIGIHLVGHSIDYPLDIFICNVNLQIITHTH